MVKISDLQLTCLKIPDNYADKLISRVKLVPMPVYLVIFFLFVIVYGYFKSSEPVMPIYLQF